MNSIKVQIKMNENVSKIWANYFCQWFLTAFMNVALWIKSCFYLLLNTAAESRAGIVTSAGIKNKRTKPISEASHLRGV